MSNFHNNWDEFCPCDDCRRRPRPRPCHHPKPRPCCCCEEENIFTPCRPRPCSCNTCCEPDCENLFVSPDHGDCCDNSIANELCRLIGKKVFICLQKKRGPVVVLDVDGNHVKALVPGCGKIIFINIDSIVSFKEIC